jgi:hypothetical protein
MANRFGQADHRPFGALGLELVYGRRPDGTLAHVSETPSGLACECVCPACGRRLVARRGAKTAHHFAHLGQGGACAAAGETNAHIWAKRVLERTRRILLPAIEAEDAGRKLVSRRASFFAFDEVRLEQRMGEIVPDVVLRAKTRELIVEVWVTHRCDDLKIAKIRERGLSAIEVDLSRFRACDDEQAVERALLSAAPRTWIFNPFVESAKQALRQRIDAEEAAREAAAVRRARQLAASIRNAQPELSDQLRRERDQLLTLGRRACFEQPCRSSDGFVVPPSMWQAAIFVRVFLPQAGQPRWRRLGVCAADVLDEVKDCLAPALRKPLARRLVQALQQEAPDLVLPAQAIEDYLRRLAEAGVLHDDGVAFSLSDAESAELASLLQSRKVAQDRLDTARRQVLAVLARLPDAERQTFNLEAWLQQRLPPLGRSVAELAGGDATDWWRLEERLGVIERMFFGGPAPSELLGLPLQAAAERAREALRLKEAETRRREAELHREAAAGRAASLIARAETVLGAEAEAWLRRPGRKSGLTPVEAAERDETGYHAALGALSRLADEQRRQAERDRLVREAQDALRRAAHERFPEAHAEIFLTAGHPDLGGVRPIDYCRDPVTLRTCLTLLPAKRGRRVR